MYSIVQDFHWEMMILILFQLTSYLLHSTVHVKVLYSHPSSGVVFSYYCKDLKGMENRYTACAQSDL